MAEKMADRAEDEDTAFFLVEFIEYQHKERISPFKMCACRGGCDCGTLSEIGPDFNIYSFPSYPSAINVERTNAKRQEVGGVRNGDVRRGFRR